MHYPYASTYPYVKTDVPLNYFDDDSIVVASRLYIGTVMKLLGICIYWTHIHTYACMHAHIHIILFTYAFRNIFRDN